jgi:hypothetical protein
MADEDPMDDPADPDAPAQTTLASFDQDPDDAARDDAATLEQTVSANVAKIEALKETVERMTDLVDRLAEQQAAADPDTASDVQSTPDADPGETPSMFQ